MRSLIQSGLMPHVDLNFLNMSSLDPRIVFARSSAANYFDSTGTLQSAATGVPRFDCSMAGTLQGLLIEDAATNYALQARDLTNASWVKSSMTTAKTATGIDGVANSATTITASGANGTALQTITRVSAARITSAYVKRVTGSGTVNMTQNNGTTWTVITVTASWTRVSIPTATAANPVIGFRLVTSADAISVDFVQHEETAYVTSPVATTTVAVARSADSAYITYSGYCVGAPNTGTLAAEWYSVGSAVLKTVTCAGSSSNAFNNSATLYENSGGGFELQVTNNSVYQFSGSPIGWSSVGVNRAATAWGNGYAGFGGTLVTNVVAGGPPGTFPAMQRLGLGCLTDLSAPLMGWLRRVRFWNSRLPNSFVKSLGTL